MDGQIIFKINRKLLAIEAAEDLDPIRIVHVMGYFSSCWFEQRKVLIMEHIAFWWRSCNTARRFSLLQPWGCKFLEFSSEWSPSRMIVARPNLMVIRTMLIVGFNIQICVKLIEGLYLYLLSSFGFEICPALHLCVASSIFHPLSLVQSELHWASVHATLRWFPSSNQHLCLCECVCVIHIAYIGPTICEFKLLTSHHHEYRGTIKRKKKKKLTTVSENHRWIDHI